MANLVYPDGASTATGDPEMYFVLTMLAIVIALGLVGTYCAFFLEDR